VNVAADENGVADPRCGHGIEHTLPGQQGNRPTRAFPQPTSSGTMFLVPNEVRYRLSELSYGPHHAIDFANYVQSSSHAAFQAPNNDLKSWNYFQIQAMQPLPVGERCRKSRHADWI
jgi:hypothetical protein